MESIKPGDIYLADIRLAGEQDSFHWEITFVMVVSHDDFNLSSPPIVVRIIEDQGQATQIQTRLGYAVELEVNKTKSFALCNQIRSVDLEDLRREGKCTLIAAAPTEIVEDVIQKIISFLVLGPPQT